jgi:hypothetical protein
MGSEKPLPSEVKTSSDIKRGPPRTDAALDKEAFGFRNQPAASGEEKKETPAALTKSSGPPIFSRGKAADKTADGGL